MRNKMPDDKNIILSFTSIRFIWSLSIVFCHVYLAYDDVIDFGIFNFLTHGGFGVTHFFILSGFLVCMHHERDYDHGCKMKDVFEYTFRNIGKWYMLHIVTMIIGVYINFGTVGLLHKIVLNIFLVQAWKAPYNNSLNRVAWYLSCLFALYLITPILLYLNKWIRKKRKVCVICFIVLTIASFIMGNVLSSGFYFHPLYRSLQYASGGVLHNIIKDQKFANGNIFCIFSLIIELVVYLIVCPVYSVLFDFVAAVIFIVAFYNYDILSNRILVKLGNISLEIFLLHYPIIRIVTGALRQTFPQDGNVYLGEMAALVIVSMAMAVLWNKIFGKKL